LPKRFRITLHLASYFHPKFIPQVTSKAPKKISCLRKLKMIKHAAVASKSSEEQQATAAASNSSSKQANNLSSRQQQQLVAKEQLSSSCLPSNQYS